MDTHHPESSDVVLARLEASIEEALHRLIDGGRLNNGHRVTAEGLRQRLAGLRERLARAESGEGAVEIPDDAKSDFNLLAWDFKRWLAQIDEDFENRAPHAPGLGRGAPG